MDKGKDRTCNQLLRSTVVAPVQYFALVGVALLSGEGKLEPSLLAWLDWDLAAAPAILLLRWLYSLTRRSSVMVAITQAMIHHSQ